MSCASHGTMFFVVCATHERSPRGDMRQRRNAVMRAACRMRYGIGDQPARTVGLVGSRMSWAGRHSREMLTSRHYRAPPLGLLEWLSFVPAEIAVYGHDGWHFSVLHCFVADHKRTWTTRCAIAVCRQPHGPHVGSPILLPLRAFWIDPFDRAISIAAPA